MATSNSRQRKLARAKLDRQIARNADRTRRQRQARAATVGVLTLALLGLGGAWLGGAFDKKPEPTAGPPADCTWNAQNVTANPDLRDVGGPNTHGLPKSGSANMEIAFNTGAVTVQLDRAAAPCSAASLEYLAGEGFYDNTTCHELTHGAEVFALRCGDPSGTGNGGANYTWFPENVPDLPTPTPSADGSADPSASPTADPSADAEDGSSVRYPKGTVAMMSSLNGSQFLIFYQDSTIETVNYSVIGRVVAGLDIVEQIAANGTVENSAGLDTKPKDDVTIQTLTVVTKEES